MRVAVRSIERSTLMVVCMVVGSGCRIAQAQCLEGCKAIHVLTGEVTGDQFGWKCNYLGDLNDDGAVGAADLLILLANWG